jgi:hypothetical protein
MANHPSHPAPGAVDPALAPPPDDQNQALLDARAVFIIVLIGVALFVGSVFLFIF